jgi:hypothetical protein
LVSESDRKYTEHRVEQMHCVTKTRGSERTVHRKLGTYRFCRLFIFK